VADIAMYLIRFCDVLKINLEEAIEDKFIENGNKYPVELFKGSSKKYNHRNN
jgi:NTP pyrophosphatase (non-canonical NTP hydrolase)